MTEQTPTPTKMKQCPYCGKMTAVEANFCWWCTRELTARPERPESSTSSRPARIPIWAWIILGVVVVIAIILFLVL